MNVYVTNRQYAEQYNNISVSHKIISIHTPGDAPAKVKTNTKTRGVLHLEFHDANPSRHTASESGALVLFDDNMAGQIVQFMNPLPEVVLVHCDAGISRSAGVGAALARFFNGSDQQFWETPAPYQTRYRPNSYVYQKLLLTLLRDAAPQSERIQ